jgi:hypothetical protein
VVIKQRTAAGSLNPAAAWGEAGGNLLRILLVLKLQDGPAHLSMLLYQRVVDDLDQCVGANDLGLPADGNVQGHAPELRFYLGKNTCLSCRLDTRNRRGHTA